MTLCDLVTNPVIISAANAEVVITCSTLEFPFHRCVFGIHRRHITRITRKQITLSLRPRFVYFCVLS